MSVMEKTQVELGDIVRVIYKGWKGSDRTDSLHIMWDSKSYDLKPGIDSFIPFEAAACWFGDPRAGERVISNRDNRGLVGFIPDRATEVRRLRTKYGNEGGSDELVHLYPYVEIYTLDGDRILSVLDDPRGDTVTTAKPTVSDNAQLLEIVTKQQQTIDFLMSKVATDTPSPEVKTDAEDEEPAIELAMEDDPSPAFSAEFPPEDEGTRMAPTSEQSTGERGGRVKTDQPIDWSSLSANLDE